MVWVIFIEILYASTRVLVLAEYSSIKLLGQHSPTLVIYMRCEDIASPTVALTTRLTPSSCRLGLRPSVIFQFLIILSAWPPFSAYSE